MMGNYMSKDMMRCNYLLGEMEATYHEMALKLGLSDSAMKILYTICETGDSRLLSEVCRLSGLSKQTVNSSIRKLEAENILYLEKAGSKSKRICLTEAGKILTKKTVLRIQQSENDILASWPQQDVEKYLELTERFLNDLKKKAMEV